MQHFLGFFRGKAPARPKLEQQTYLDNHGGVDPRPYPGSDPTGFDEHGIELFANTEFPHSSRAVVEKREHILALPRLREQRFNISLVGYTGAGKSSLVDTIANALTYNDARPYHHRMIAPRGSGADDHKTLHYFLYDNILHDQPWLTCPHRVAIAVGDTIGLADTIEAAPAICEHIITGSVPELTPLDTAAISAGEPVKERQIHCIFFVQHYGQAVKHNLIEGLRDLLATKFPYITVIGVLTNVDLAPSADTIAAERRQLAQSLNIEVDHVFPIANMKTAPDEAWLLSVLSLMETSMTWVNHALMHR